MAIDLTLYELPVAPGTATGIYELPDEQAAVILDYAAALWAAKQAGVAGDQVRLQQQFIDRVVGDRVRAAGEGAMSWTAACDAMQRDVMAWQVRIGSREVRALRRQSGPGTQARANAVMAVVHEAETLGTEVLDRLDATFAAVVARDDQLTEAALPGVPQPYYGSLRLRATRSFDDHPEAEKVRRTIETLPPGAWHAAVGCFLGDTIPTPYRAILCGAWDEVVHGIPTTINPAWTDEAQVLRQNFLDLPPKAHEVVDPYAF